MNDIRSKKIINLFIRIFSIASFTITLLSLFLAAGLKIETVSTYILSLYPRYNLSMEAIKIFKDSPQPITINNEILLSSDTNQPLLATLLSIEHPSWSVILDFIKSDIAFSKSESIEPSEQPSYNLNTTDNFVLSEINFDHIKTIFIIHLSKIPKVGNKPLVAAYRTAVFDSTSPTSPRYVYDFISFDEFILDLKKMLVNELELYSIILAIIALLFNRSLNFIKKHFKAYLNINNSKMKSEQLNV